MPKANEWKENEVGYCDSLVRTGGSRAVPAAQVMTYLNLQLEDAVKDGHIEAAQAILAAIRKWRGEKR